MNSEAKVSLNPGYSCANAGWIHAVSTALQLGERRVCELGYRQRFQLFSMRIL